MSLLRRERRLGANLRRPQGLGLSFADAGDLLIEDYAQPPVQDFYAQPVQDFAMPPEGGEIVSDPIAPPAPNVTPTVSVQTASGNIVAMPATTTALPSSTSTAYDGTPITSPVTLPDNTVAPIGSTIIDNGVALVIGYPDGSGRIIYKNAPPPDDPECQNLTTADINRGVICYTDPKGSRRYVATEDSTGQPLSWGELKAGMDAVAGLNPQFAQSARWNFYYYNPSWHMVIGGAVDPTGKYKTADGSSLAWAITNGNYSILGYPDDYVPSYIGPTESSGGAQMFIVDDDGTRIDITDGIEPEQQEHIDELIYGPVEDRSPGQPGYTPPVYSGPPLDETGSVLTPTGTPGGGGYSGPITTPNTSVNTGGEPSAVAPNNTAMLVAAGLAAFFLLRRR